MVVEDAREVESRALQLGEGPLEDKAPMVEVEDAIGGGEQVELMGHQDAGAVVQVLDQGFFHQKSRHLRVHCGKRVIQEVEVGLRVEGASEGDARLLASTEVDATLRLLASTEIGELGVVLFETGDA